ncbi:MAG TPA: hypothetical protein PLR41_09600 [Alphaproteobacteria bacterium]|nr:hypothetical protein [Alphaproteobacteria bacterium]
MSGIFDDPFTAPDGSRIVSTIIDEETQLQRYLVDMALTDLELLPDPSRRRVRPGSLAEAYRTDVAARHAIEAKNEAAEVDEFVVEAEEFRPKQEG